MTLADYFHQRPSWMDDAACRGSHPATFFPASADGLAAPISVCDTCAVKTECLEYAIANNETSGVWGGTSERERRKIRKRRGLEALPPPDRFQHDFCTANEYARQQRGGVEPCAGCRLAHAHYQEDRRLVSGRPSRAKVSVNA